MQDFHLLEKLAHQNRERIPERTVHAEGSGAYGTLTVTNDIARYTKAAALSQVGKKTEAFLRLSTVAGERRAADAERDVRGFALRFYTEQGNWGIVGNNTPVFFIRDGLKFPDFIHTQKRHPRTNLGNVDRYSHRDGNDDYRQAGDLFRLMSSLQKEQLFENIRAAMDGVPVEIVKRQVAHFYRADPDYGVGVAKRMGLAASDLPAEAAE